MNDKLLKNIGIVAVTVMFMIISVAAAALIIWALLPFNVSYLYVLRVLLAVVVAYGILVGLKPYFEK